MSTADGSRNPNQPELPRDVARYSRYLGGYELDMIERWLALIRRQPHLDLRLRRDLGGAFNACVGHPHDGAYHRTLQRAVRKRAAWRLQITEDEFDQMRWFAYLFRDVKDLKRRFPEVSTWEGVVGLLAAFRCLPIPSPVAKVSRRKASRPAQAGRGRGR